MDPRIDIEVVVFGNERAVRNDCLDIGDGEAMAMETVKVTAPGVVFYLGLFLRHLDHDCVVLVLHYVLLHHPNSLNASRMVLYHFPSWHRNLVLQPHV